MNFVIFISGVIHDVRESLSIEENCDVSSVLGFDMSGDASAFLLRSTSANIIEYTYILLSIMNTGYENYSEEFVKHTLLPLCSATVDTLVYSEHQIVSMWRRSLDKFYDGVIPKPIKDTMLSITKRTDITPSELDIFTRISKLLLTVESKDLSLF